MEQWYYAANGAQLGPVTIDVLQQAIARGEISPADLVWKDGMAEWTPAQRVPELANSFGAGGDGGAYSVGAGYPQPGYGQQAYAQPVGAVGYANPQIGYYTPPQARVYAGFWWRFLAVVIDGFVLLIPNLIINLGTEYGLRGVHPLVVMAANFSLTSVVGWIYFAIQESSVHQATWGKRACGITVTDLAGNRISFGQASGRYFGKLLSYFTLYIGFIMQAFTEKRQALHDMISGCLVFKKP